MLTIVVIAVVLGVMPAAIAQNKGHDFVAWWVFGALLFIVALPMALMLEPEPEAVTQRKAGLRKCPYCAEYIKPEAIVCRYCGRDVEPSSTTAVDRSSPDYVVDMALMLAGQKERAEVAVRDLIQLANGDKRILSEAERQLGLKMGLGRRPPGGKLALRYLQAALSSDSNT